MVLAILITVGYVLLIWLVFFRLKLTQFSITWAVVSAIVGAHVLLIFLVGLRFVTPYSTNARVIQHTIQLIPRLSAPTLVTAVLVKPNTPIRKGQPLFQFDRRPYEYNVRKLEAELAQAKQNVRILQADLEVAQAKVPQMKSELVFARVQQQRAAGLAKKGAGPLEDAQKWDAQLEVAEASVKEAQAEVDAARLKYESELNGINTTVASVQAELELARYYLENTTMVAPEDGYIINLQVRPGMVAGILRAGAIASFICAADRYLLANYDQESLKYVKVGQPAEVALDLYPGQIFQGRVASIWRASRAGQLLPSGDLPGFNPLETEMPQGHFGVVITFADSDQSKFPIGARGASAIYVSGGGFAALRRIGIRSYSWLNWLYPLQF